MSRGSNRQPPVRRLALVLVLVAGAVGVRPGLAADAEIGPVMGLLLSSLKAAGRSRFPVAILRVGATRMLATDNRRRRRRPGPTLRHKG